MATLVQAAGSVRSWPYAEEQLLRAMGAAGLIMAAVLSNEAVPLSTLLMTKSRLQDLDSEWRQLLWMFVERVRRQGASELEAATMLLRFLIQGSITKSEFASATFVLRLCSLQHQAVKMKVGSHTEI